MSTSQATPRAAGSHQQQEEARKDSPLQLPEGANPANTSIMHLQPPKLQENEFLFFEAPWFVVSGYSSPGKHTHAGISELDLDPVLCPDGPACLPLACGKEQKIQGRA